MPDARVGEEPPQLLEIHQPKTVEECLDRLIIRLARKPTERKSFDQCRLQGARQELKAGE